MEIILIKSSRYDVSNEFYFITANIYTVFSRLIHIICTHRFSIVVVLLLLLQVHWNMHIYTGYIYHRIILK